MSTLALSLQEQLRRQVTPEDALAIRRRGEGASLGPSQPAAAKPDATQELQRLLPMAARGDQTAIQRISGIQAQNQGDILKRAMAGDTTAVGEMQRIPTMKKLSDALVAQRQRAESNLALTELRNAGAADRLERSLQFRQQEGQRNRQLKADQFEKATGVKQMQLDENKRWHDENLKLSADRTRQALELANRRDLAQQDKDAALNSYRLLDSTTRQKAAKISEMNHLSATVRSAAKSLELATDAEKPQIQAGINETAARIKKLQGEVDTLSGQEATHKAGFEKFATPRGQTTTRPAPRGTAQEIADYENSMSGAPQVKPAATQPTSQPTSAPDGQVIVNPKTGQKLVKRAGKWQPLQ